MSLVSWIRTETFWGQRDEKKKNSHDYFVSRTYPGH